MTGALIIAAGKTAGKDKFRPGRRVGAITAIERSALTLQRAGIKRIAVVSDEDEQAQKLVPSMSLVFLNAPKDGEMLHSIQLGLEYLQDKCHEAVIVHVDVPLFSARTVKQLLNTPGDVCIPRHDGRCGHPALLRAPLFPAILSYSGGGGLKSAIIASGASPVIVDVEDGGILKDAAGRGAYPLPDDRDSLRAAFTVRICKEKPFYGPGPHQLLQLTEELGSLSNACRYMGISYTKGRKIIHTMEEQLGHPVLLTCRGGSAGGCSLLAPEAKALMQSYDSFCGGAEAALKELFDRHFSRYSEG